jgi:hypothetical protein
VHRPAEPRTLLTWLALARSRADRRHCSIGPAKARPPDLGAPTRGAPHPVHLACTRTLEGRPPPLFEWPPPGPDCHTRACRPTSAPTPNTLKVSCPPWPLPMPQQPLGGPAEVSVWASRPPCPLRPRGPPISPACSRVSPKARGASLKVEGCAVCVCAAAAKQAAAFGWRKEPLAAAPNQEGTPHPCAASQGATTQEEVGWHCGLGQGLTVFCGIFGADVGWKLDSGALFVQQARPSKARACCEPRP